jgi:DNA-binding transcriptional ArsR family regulator
MQKVKEWIKNNNISELSEMLRAISHPSRMAIIFLLSNEPAKRMSVKCVYSHLEMPQPVISRHLGILRNCGFAIRIVEGSNTFYQLNEKNKTARRIIRCFSTSFIS